MPPRRDAIFLVFGLAAFAILVGLGLWQIERREWKGALIAQITERATAEPVTLARVEQMMMRGEDPEFVRVTATGRYLHDRELYVFATSGSLIGWKLVTPLATGSGDILVDRGFVPSELRDPGVRPESQPSGEVTVTGSVRLHRLGKGPFIPDNDPLKNVWHWWDLPSMAHAAGIGEAAPFVLQSEPQPGDPPWPRAALIDPTAIPNRHLGYALTWFGLAVVLIVMMGMYFARRWREG
jgi:surfeit locus 1 family protein